MLILNKAGREEGMCPGRHHNRLNNSDDIGGD